MLHKLIKAAQLHDDADPASIADTIWLAMRMATPNPASIVPPTARNVPPPADSAPKKPDAVVPPETRLAKQAGDSDDEGQTPLTPGRPKNAAQNQGASQQKWIGALPTLPGKPQFRQALRAFRSHAPQLSCELDENETAEQYARQGGQILLPVMQKSARRWLKISLLAETGGSNALWTQPLDELERLLRLQGTFRAVRRKALRTDHAAYHWWKNEIVIVASDFTSDAWWDGPYPQLMRKWSMTQPLLLMHTLPARLWARSWTGVPDAFATASTVAQATGTLRIALDPAQLEFEKPSSRLAFPLIGMESRAFGDWAMALMQNRVKRMPAILLALRATPNGQDVVGAKENADNEQASAPPRSPEETVMAFKMLASPLARKLAQYMALVAPLNFPVMRWVQQAILPESDASHLAEFVLGGLLEQVDGDATAKPDEVRYDFAHGVRPLLQQGLPISHALEVMHTVGAFLEANDENGLQWRTVVDTWDASEFQGLSAELNAFALVSRAFMRRICLHGGGGDIGRRVNAPSANGETIKRERKHILWVDDRPNNNLNERKQFEEEGFRFTLARTTNEALDILAGRRFAALISDMGRVEGPREGYVLLDAMRNRGDNTPFFIYAGSNSKRHQKEIRAHGGQGSTNIFTELFAMVKQEVAVSEESIIRHVTNGSQQSSKTQVAATEVMTNAAMASLVPDARDQVRDAVKTFRIKQFAPPKSGEIFEDLCLELFRAAWQDTAVKKNGRRGQAQNGVDIVGHNYAQGGGLWGIECKGSRLTVREIQQYLAKADTFSPKLAHWIIATTAPTDAKLQEFARFESEKRVSQGMFPITVLDWAALCELLHIHQEVAQYFYLSAYPFHLPDVRLSQYFFDPLNQLEQLRLQFEENENSAAPAAVALQGIEGVGKTQLAIKYSHQYRTQYAGVWWFRAENMHILEQGCLVFCEANSIAVPHKASAHEAVKNWLAAQPRWLLVYDNAEDEKALLTCLPQSGAHHMLITSRLRMAAGMMGVMVLDVWRDEHPLAFLRQRLPDAHDEELRQLAAMLGGLPLDVEKACFYIYNNSVSLADYIKA